MPPKNIAIYFSDPDPMGYPFTKDYYFEIYSQIIAAIEARGPRVYIVRGNSYQGDGWFSAWYRLVDLKLIGSDKPVRADLIFNRDDKNTIPRVLDCPIINHPDLDELCMDKVATARRFPLFSPRTEPLNSFADYERVSADWQLQPGDLVVLKKNFQTEGRGVFVLPAGEVKGAQYADWKDTLVQEFLDSSLGIPGCADGRHDLRINVVNNRPINAYVRQPPAGSFLANVAQGGSGRSIELAAVPPPVLSYVAAIIAELAAYAPSVFSADFINSPSGYKLVEMNSRPMVQHYKWFSSYRLFNDAIVDMLVEAVEAKQAVPAAA